MIGKTVSHYKITGKLGAGGMGVVYEAEDTKIQRTVALKFLPENLTKDIETKARFIREAQTAGQLDHPNVCTIHEIGETEDGQLFIAMAYYDGASLAEKLTDGPLPLDEALDLASQIAAGLDKAHAAGVVHRDIKPANILLTSDGLVKVADFGLAKLTDQTNLTKTGTTLGSGSYMAPEQASGEEADNRADIWSLSVVIYEMLTGERPFQGDFLPAVVYAIVHQDPKVPSALNPKLTAEIDDALLTGLAKDPAERFSSAGELIEALGAEVGSVSRRPKPRPKIKPSERTPGFTIPRRVALGVLALAVAVAGVFGLSQMGGKGPNGPLAPVSPNSRSLVVLPFSFRGQEVDQHYAEQFTQVLADRLVAVGDLHVVAGDTLLPYLTDEEKLGADFGVLVSTAKRLQANLVVGGQVTVTQGNLQVRLTFADQNRVFDTYSGPAEPLDQILAYSNDMALKSVSNLFPGNQHQLSRMAAVSSDNWEVVSHFIESEHYRNLMYLRGWRKELDACFQADSTFALAYYSLFQLESWFGNERAMREAARQARRHGRPLSQEGRDLIEAVNLYVDYEIDEAENLIHRILLNNNEFVESWYFLAAIFYTSNQFRGRSMLESMECFDQIRLLDPKNRIPGIFLRFLWPMAGEIDLLEQYMTPEDGSPMPGESQGLLAFLRDDISAQEALADSLHVNGLYVHQAIILNSPDNHWNSLRYLNHLRPQVSEGSALGWVEETLAHLESGVGRWDEARKHFGEMPEGFLPWRLTYQAIMTSMPFMQCPPEEIRELVSEIESWRPLANFTLDPDLYGLVEERYSPDYALHPYMKEFSLALLQTRLGDLNAARAALFRLETLPIPPGNAPMVNEMVLSVRGWIAYEEEDYSGVLNILKGSALHALPNMGYSGLHDRPFQRYLRALALEKLGRYEEAAPWFDHIDEKTERTLGFVAPAHLRLGGIYEKTGDTEKALHHYRAFLNLYRECDERYQPLVEEARQRVAVLEI